MLDTNVIRFIRSDCKDLHERVQQVDSGDLIVATALAGRGTDIKLTPKAIQKGGLAVIINYLPSSVRTQQQIQGRSGRNGEPGTSIMIFSHKFGEFKSNSALDLVIQRDSEEKKRLKADMKGISRYRRQEREFNKVRKKAIDLREINHFEADVLLESLRQKQLRDRYSSVKLNHSTRDAKAIISDRKKIHIDLTMSWLRYRRSLCLNHLRLLWLSC